jgi:hypothetical protein
VELVGRTPLTILVALVSPEVDSIALALTILPTPNAVVLEEVKIGLLSTF